MEGVVETCSSGTDEYRRSLAQLGSILSSAEELAFYAKHKSEVVGRQWNSIPTYPSPAARVVSAFGNPEPTTTVEEPPRLRHPTATYIPYQHEARHSPSHSGYAPSYTHSLRHVPVRRTSYPNPSIVGRNRAEFGPRISRERGRSPSPKRPRHYEPPYPLRAPLRRPGPNGSSSRVNAELAASTPIAAAEAIAAELLRRNQVKAKSNVGFVNTPFEKQQKGELELITPNTRPLSVSKSLDPPNSTIDSSSKGDGPSVLENGDNTTSVDSPLSSSPVPSSSEPAQSSPPAAPTAPQREPTPEPSYPPPDPNIPDAKLPDHPTMPLNKLHVEFPMWQRAVELYHQVKHNKEVASRQPEKKRQPILAAILYILCRQNGLPRTFSEFCHHATVSKKDIGGFYRILTPILDPQGICARPVLAENFMKRWCNELRLPDVIFEKAVEVYKRAEELSLTSGKCPTSVSSAVLYFVCTEPDAVPTASHQTYDSREFAMAAGVTNATLHSSLKALTLHREQLLPDG